MAKDVKVRAFAAAAMGDTRHPEEMAPAQTKVLTKGRMAFNFVAFDRRGCDEHVFSKVYFSLCPAFALPLLDPGGGFARYVSLFEIESDLRP
jgi:hypothetical protein